MLLNRSDLVLATFVLEDITRFSDSGRTRTLTWMRNFEVQDDQKDSSPQRLRKKLWLIGDRDLYHTERIVRLKRPLAKFANRPKSSGL